MKYIEVRNLRYKNIFKGVSFCLTEKWNSFYGNEKRDELISILLGNCDYEGYINIDGNFLNKNAIYNLKNKLYLVDRKSVSYFVGNNLYDELLMTGNNKELIDDYIINFRLSDYKFSKIDTIPFDKKIIVSILYGILKKYKFIYLNNVLCFLEKEDIIAIYNLFIKNNIVVLNFTTNPDELIFSSKVILLKDFDELDVKSINDIKIIDLCDRLINYGILDQKYTSIEGVVSNL